MNACIGQGLASCLNMRNASLKAEASFDEIFVTGRGSVPSDLDDWAKRIINPIPLDVELTKITGE